jgi:hypothetical protein
VLVCIGCYLVFEHTNNCVLQSSAIIYMIFAQAMEAAALERRRKQEADDAERLRKEAEEEAERMRREEIEKMTNKCFYKE